MQLDEVMAQLRAEAGPRESLEGMARYGINTSNALGITMPKLRALAKEIGKDHALAFQLWDTGVHEARILASLVDDPHLVTEEQLDRWAAQIDSWDVCDQCCGNLFDKTAFAYSKVAEWSKREEEFVKRAAFSLIAYLASHRKKDPDRLFLEMLPIIEREAGDGRNFVKKAVNWALRGIGKRSAALNEAAIASAQRIAAQGSGTARWVAADALRELTSAQVQQRLAGTVEKAAK